MSKKSYTNMSTKEGSMGGINRCAPAQDVSYEKVLDEKKPCWKGYKQIGMKMKNNKKVPNCVPTNEDEIFEYVIEKYRSYLNENMNDCLNELSVDKLNSYKDAASSENSARTRPLRKLAKSAENVRKATDKINKKLGQGPKRSPSMGAYEGKIEEFLENPDDVEEAYEGPWQGDPVKWAKAPKSQTYGKGDIKLSDLVQDTIRVHGIKDAFEFYVKKHGMPPRHFKIYAGL